MPNYTLPAIDNPAGLSGLQNNAPVTQPGYCGFSFVVAVTGFEDYVVRKVVVR